MWKECILKMAERMNGEFQQRYRSCKKEPCVEVLQLKNVKSVTEMSLDGNSSILGTRKERISALEYKLIDIIQTTVHSGKTD